MKNMKFSTDLIKLWAIARDLDKADSFRQFTKHCEEFGELLRAESKEEEILEIGDNVVTLTILCLQNGIDIMECFDIESDSFDRQLDTEGMIFNGLIAEALCKKDPEKLKTAISMFLIYLDGKCLNIETELEYCALEAYRKISGRTGKMIDGVFVKNSDIKLSLINDCRNLCPEDEKIGIYYVVKKNQIACFSFGKSISTFETIKEAHNALTAFLEKRKDADELTVTLLNNHW